MKKIPFAKPYFSIKSREKIVSAIDEILSSGQLMMGEYTSNFETSFASYVNASVAVTTNSCTTALQICLMHYDVRGHEVLVPSASFITDVSAVKWAGATPVLVDTDPKTLSFDLDDLKRKLTSKTKGIIWIHLTGLISKNWREIKDFAKENGLFLIEDCAHAHGASVDGLMAGAIGDAGCFSFFPTKVMTTGTGGIITTSDSKLENSAKELRLFGRKNGTGEVVREGNDWFMDEIRACLGYYQLQDLDVGIARRREIANRYNRGLKEVSGISFLNVTTGNLPAWYHYTVFVNPAIDYQKLSKALLEKYGIPTKPIYTPAHQEAIFRELDDGSLLKTEQVLNYSLCLPVFVEMTDHQVDYVVDSLSQELDKSCRLAFS